MFREVQVEKVGEVSRSLISKDFQGQANGLGLFPCRCREAIDRFKQKSDSKLHVRKIPLGARVEEGLKIRDS